MSTSTDEQKRRTAPVRLRRSKRRAAEESANAILESMSDGFVAIDREWRYTYVNRVAEQMARLPREEMLGRTVVGSVPKNRRYANRARAPPRDA